MKKIGSYIENIWIGDDKKPSLKRVLSIVFSLHIVHIVNTCKDMSNVALVIGVESGLIAALLGLASYQSVQYSKDKQ